MHSFLLHFFIFYYRKLITVEKPDNGTFGFEIQVGSFKFSRLVTKMVALVVSGYLQRKKEIGIGG